MLTVNKAKYKAAVNIIVKIVTVFKINQVAYSKPYQRSKMEFFVEKVNARKLLTIFAKRSILDAWQGSEYPSGCGNLFFTYF